MTMASPKVQPAGVRRRKPSKTGVPIKPVEAAPSLERQLYRAAQESDIFALKRFCTDRGGDVNARIGTQGGGAIHVAASTGTTACVLWLLANTDGRLKVDQQTDSGFTALHFACMRGHFKIARLLVERGGANPLVANAYNKFAVDYLNPAMEDGRDIFELLEYYMKKRLTSADWAPHAEKAHDSGGSDDEEDTARKQAIAVRAQAALVRQQTRRRQRRELREVDAEVSASIVFWLCCLLALAVVVAVPLAYHHDRGHGIIGDFRYHILGKMR